MPFNDAQNLKAVSILTCANLLCRSHVELAEGYSKARKVIDTLFPSSSLEQLSLMTRQQLLKRLDTFADPPSTSEDFSHDDLLVLEPLTEQNFTWDEFSEHDSETSRIADDVNGLAFSRQSLNTSYLGLSSVPTILRVIAHIRPGIQKRVSEDSQAWRSSSWLMTCSDEPSILQIDEASLVDAYFDRIHTIIPMIDEAEFRYRYDLTKLSPDSTNPWLALLNMVLAMGSLASDSMHFNSHNIFYKRALSYLSITSFGSGHIYMVQALALYSGMALHFFNRPNTASAIMGATIQMAVAMGLHRVQRFRVDMNSPCCPTTGTADTQIGTWWTLLCLDTWASSTLGRPSPGYWNPATVTTPIPSTLRSSDHGMISLAASESFCRIAARIQERLIQLPIISLEEAKEFDRDLLGWKDSLHAFLAHKEQCPSNLHIARATMWWRYITTRLILYRPTLLITAVRRKPWDGLSTNERTALRNCVEIAIEGIDMMSIEWSPNQVICWNIAWNLFQVALVLVLCMMSHEDLAKEYKCNAGCTRSRKILQLLFDNARDLEAETTSHEGHIMSHLALDSLNFDLLGEDIDWLAEFCGGAP
ncbi:lactose regulatory lac9 [Fusarium heterosporum]|uniref:Lactose regulatory lac9 n=1 Tax=Fusarium heterosporum TaxID=42747 RepID=A0A8H5T2A0_FUSHE|nr:lactose regulatory lac9 [Fusarium heterosporum]